jgi:hypothetical protein
MQEPATFDEVLDAIEHLPADQQAEVVAVVRRRLAERGRQRVADDARDARAELVSGKLRPSSVDDIVREIET